MKKKEKSMKWMSLVLATALVVQPVWAKDYTGHWAEKAIDKWSSYGIIKGRANGDFAPSESVTRAELATFINRVFQFTQYENNRTYEDIKEGAWYTEAISAVTNKGLMYIPSRQFEPNRPATREEVAYTIAKAYHIDNEQDTTITFKDAKDISIWAQQAVQALAANGVIKGSPDGSFRPQDPITRAEVVTILENLTPVRLQAEGTYTGEVYEGSVMITSPNVTLEDTIIKGDVYITEGVGEGKVKLEGVTIYGDLYIEGGKVTLSGTYNQVHLKSMAPFDFIKGTIQKLIVTVANPSIRLREKTVTDYLLVEADAKFNLEGIVKESSINSANKLMVEEAYAYIGGKQVPLEVEGTQITLNLNKLQMQTSSFDTFEGIMITTNVEGAYIQGPFGGSMLTNTPYAFQTANKQLGLFDEVMDQVMDTSPRLKALAQDLNLSSDTLFTMIMAEGNFSVGQIREQFDKMNKLVYLYTGDTLPQTYTIKRNLRYENALPVQITICLEVQ